MKFHDGSDFTAEDVKFSIERIPIVSGPNPTTIYVRRVKETKVVDPHTHPRRHRRAGADPAERLHPPVHRLGEGGRGPDQGERQRGLQLRQGGDRHRPVPVRLLDAEGGARARALRRLLARRRPGSKVVRKEIPNDAARVAQLKAGQVDMIVRVPAADVPTLEKDAEAQDRQGRHGLRLQHRVRLPREASADLRQGRLAAAAEPVQRRRGCARPSTSPSTGRRSPRSSMEGLGKPVDPDGDPQHLRLQREAPGAEAERAARAPAPGARPATRTASRSSSTSPTTACPATAPSAPRSRRCSPASASRCRRTASRRAVLFPARTRGDYSFVMSGWGTLTGEAHYTLSSLGALERPAAQDRRLQLARLHEPGARQAAAGRPRSSSTRASAARCSRRPARCS